MKTVQLASAGQKHLVSTYKQPEAWGDDHVNNAWSLTDALPELQCLAVKALAVAINQGDLIDTFLDGIPVSWDKSRLDVYKISNPNQLSLYDVSNATRKRLLMRTFGSVNNKTDIVIRPNGKGYSFSFSFNHEDLSPKDNVGLTLASITECFRRLLNYGDIPSAGSFYSSPEQLDKAMLMYDWLQRRFPKGQTVVMRIPLENLLPDEFTEMDEDGENAYYLANFREASANLKVEIFNPQTDTSEIVFSEYNTPPAIKEKYAEAFANTRYPKITLTEKEILALRDTTTLSFINNAFFGLRSRVSIEVDLDKDETDFITQGTQDVVDMADWLSAAVQVAGTEEQPNYCYGTVDLSSGVKPRTGLAQTMISPYNLTPIYIPKGVGISTYRERVREHYVGKDGYRRFNDKDSISLPNCVIGVDWLSNRMLYSQGNNRMTSLDLSDFAITKPYHITRYADNRIFSSDNAMGVSLNRIYEIVVARNLGMSEKTKEALMSLFVYSDNYRNLKLSNLWDTYLDYAMQRSGINGLDLPVFQDAEVRADLEDLGRLKALSTDNPLPFVQAICMVLDDFWETFVKDKGRMYLDAAGYSLTSLLQLVGFASVWRECYRTDKQALDFTKLADSQVNERQPDEYSQLPENYEPKPVPNLRDGVALLPHQAKVTSSLELGKQHNLLEVSAGGGKTILVITDILRKLKEGKTKVPAVFCPGHLLANYVQDANYITDGKVNVIPLRTETYNRLGAEYFEKVAKSKPINTFFVIDYGFASQEYDVAYVGTETVGYYPRAEWLRSLGIDYVWLDESHYLKNYSARTLAMREALIDVKGVTLATGTFYPTRASDIINQAALWDTGLFGYAETFESSFGVENGIMNEAARAHVNNVLTKNVVVARAKRKEWAATLPDRTVAFHFVQLSKRARDVYEAILKATLDEIKKDPVIMKLLAKSAENDEADEAELGDRLQQYLQRLEMSITCPYQDDLWQKEWGIDSPKLKTLEKICRDHINQNIPGKILVFCSYNSSVDAIYDNLSPDLKAITLRYSAATKEKDRAKFEKDDNIKIMIGIENSMNTGINAQFASRLIRVDSIYSPGQLEQGESRIARPNLKVQEFRDHLYFDWILAEKSYDATKTARLVSKILNVEKFNNMYELAYQKMKDLPVLRLNFDVIANSSDFDNELSEYLKEYIELENHIKVREVQDYRKRNPHLTPVPLKSAGLLKGSALMKHVPYIPLGGLPSVIKEDLRPINEVLMDEPDRDLKGGYVHTEYGEGIIRRVSKNTVQVEVPNAGRISLPLNTVYLIDNGIVTRSTKSIREQLARFNKLKGVSITDEAEDVVVNDTPETGFEADIVEKTEAESKKGKSLAPVDDETDSMVDIYPSYVNEFYSLIIDETTDWEQETGVDLADYGFVASGPIMYMELKRWKHAAVLKDAWKASGIKAPVSFYETLDYLIDAMKANRAKPVSFRHLQRSVTDLKSWNLERKRKTPSDKARPYFAIQDGAVYVIIDKNTTPAWPKLKNAVKVPGTKWVLEDGARWFISVKRTDLIAKVKQLIKDGVPIAELDWVKETISDFKNVTR